MSLDTIDLKQMESELRKATEIEMPNIERIREKARRLKVFELNCRQCYAIAPVATDGGQNRISFEPMNIDIVRVVDSENKEHVQLVIPLSAEKSIFKKIFTETPVLVKFMERLGICYDDVSYLLPNEKNNIPVFQGIKVLREILEWAVLLDLAWGAERQKILLLRDGLLRTKEMKKETVSKMKKSFHDAFKKNGSMLIGVAKRSKVLSYLSLGLMLEGVFNKDYPCFCDLPMDIEREAYNWATWLEGEQVFGKLHLVKLSELKNSFVYPVDIPEWLMDRRKEILEYVAETAKSSFPSVGYPHPLIKAHENAVLHGLEMEVISHYMIKAVIDASKKDERDKILSHISLGRGLSMGGWKEYG